MSTVVLIALPGALADSFSELLTRRGIDVCDIEAQTAEELAVSPDVAVAYVGQELWEEAHYRHLAGALERWQPHMGQPSSGGQDADESFHVDRVIIAPSLVATNEACRELLQASALPCVGVTASPRSLAHAIGLTAPRSIALGPVFTTFSSMCQQREEAIGQIAVRMIRLDELSEHQPHDNEAGNQVNAPELADPVHSGSNVKRAGEQLLTAIEQALAS